MCLYDRFGVASKTINTKGDGDCIHRIKINKFQIINSFLLTTKTK